MVKIKGILNLIENGNKVLENYEFKGTKDSNNIKYKENKKDVIIIINNNDIIMKRSDEESKIILDFQDKKKTTGVYMLNSYDFSLPMDIFTDKIICSDEELLIEYKLEASTFLFNMKYRVIE